MDNKTFIASFREAFGENTQLPIAFWYSNRAIADTAKTGGCFFKHLNDIANGMPVSLTGETIGCGGGKFYCGFTDMPEFVPQFVSQKEHYKETPEMVVDMIEGLDVSKASASFLNFTRIDNLTSFDKVEALLFLTTPDILSGLATWAFFDRNEPDVVSSIFGSGCSNVVTQGINENRNNGYRSFIGFFDPSVRPHVNADILSFVVPMSRFRVMLQTMRKSCLFDTHAWAKIRQRIIDNQII